ncbi:ester cyclase [Streptomonospora arabica]|uniref:Ester cyclase n=1 Tax=Streptomonospora arabica TaxID=412417 RepID=A0ABV9SKC8_9ACTN
MTTADVKTVCLNWFDAMRSGGLEDFAARVHPEAVNREARTEPWSCRVPGPAGTHATAVLLRSAFADLDWTVHDVVAEDDMVVVHVTMSGRHVNTMYSYGEDGRVKSAFPPTGRRFAVTQTHLCRMTGGLIADHWANRDDLGMAEQLRWVPPTPAYLARMALELRRARRAEARAGGPIAEGHHHRPAPSGSE